MDFLSTLIWWIFFILRALSYFISSFGGHSRGKSSPQIEAIGGLGLIIFVVLSFIFSGWKGGIGIIVALFLWVVIAERILWLILRRLMPSASNLDYVHFIKRSRSLGSSTKQQASVEELFKQGDKTDEMLSKTLKQPPIIQVLQRYAKEPKDIEEIYLKLTMMVGKYVAQSVVENPKLLSQYLQMRADGISEMKAALDISEALGGP